MKKPIVPPSFLKQIAKKIKKEKSLSHSLALDEAARQQGFSNYKNYLNSLKANRKKAEFEKDGLLKDITTQTDLSKKLPLAISFLQRYKTPFEEALDVLKQFNKSKRALQKACACLNLREEIEEFLLRDFIDSKEIQSMPLNEHFLPKRVSVDKLVYQINEGNLGIDGDYDLEVEFEFEVPKELKGKPHFNRGPFNGDFELIIDKNRKMSIKEQSIGGDI